MFTGLSAFPLTPLADDHVDEDAFARLVQRLAAARVDSITALGSTGSYPYLDRGERARVARLAVENAGDVPVVAGIGALRTKHVLECAEDAQQAGVSAVLLAPMSYQALTEDDVFGLYSEVSVNLSVPLVVYDNPGTTHFTFTEELYARVAALPKVASIKIPGAPGDPSARIRKLRTLLPEHVTIGISGDPFAAAALDAGCDAWYSVVGGTLPEPTLEIARSDNAQAASQRLQPLWDLFARHGSLRVVAAIAEQAGLVTQPSLPRPILGLRDEDRAEVAKAVAELGIRP